MKLKNKKMCLNKIRRYLVITRQLRKQAKNKNLYTIRNTQSHENCEILEITLNIIQAYKISNFLKPHSAYNHAN